jgi:hypothetical protein
MRRIASNFSSFAKDFLKSPFTWIGLFLYSLYWVLAAVLPTVPLIEASSFLVLIGGIAIFLMWLPSFLIGVASGARIGSWQLPVAIVLTWFGLNEKHAWGLVWRFSDTPEWMTVHHFLGQANWLIFLSSFLYLISPGNDDGHVPTANWYVLVAAVSVAMFGAGAVVTALIMTS